MIEGPTFDAPNRRAYPGSPTVGITLYLTGQLVLRNIFRADLLPLGRCLRDIPGTRYAVASDGLSLMIHHYSARVCAPLVRRSPVIGSSRHFWSR